VKCRYNQQSAPFIREALFDSALTGAGILDRAAVELALGS
jgi:hypothetical protein